MPITLLTHILSAVIALGICVYAWIHPSRPLRNTLRIATIASLVSGGILAFDPGVITKTFCLKLGVYLFFIAATEYRLHKTLDQTSPSIV